MTVGELIEKLKTMPPEVLLEHGWLLPCCRCGKYDFDDEVNENMVVVDGKVYCKECYEEVSENDT